MTVSRVLVATIAHRGDDARIFERQVDALLRAGHHVVYVAPPPAPPPVATGGSIDRVVIPRAAGRRRLRALLACARAIRATAADAVVVHDLDLAAVAVHVARAPVVWDVHEDYAASVVDRSWVPSPLRRTVARAVATVERHVARRARLLVAERAYLSRHPDAVLVPNSTPIGGSTERVAPAHPVVVYVGRLAASRGVHEMIELGRRLRGRGEVRLIGAPDADVADAVQRAADAGEVAWSGYVRNSEIGAMLATASVGLCLLADLPNYRDSMPTKIVEYLAAGVPFVASDLPECRRIAEESGAGVIVPFGDVDATVDAVADLTSDAARWAAMSRRGWAYVAAHHDWNRDREAFVAAIERAAD